MNDKRNTKKAKKKKKKKPLRNHARIGERHGTNVTTTPYRQLKQDNKNNTTPHTSPARQQCLLYVAFLHITTFLGLRDCGTVVRTKRLELQQSYRGPQYIGPNIVSKIIEMQQFLSVPQVLPGTWYLLWSPVILIVEQSKNIPGTWYPGTFLWSVVLLVIQAKPIHLPIDIQLTPSSPAYQYSCPFFSFQYYYYYFKCGIHNINSIGQSGTSTLSTHRLQLTSSPSYYYYFQCGINSSIPGRSRNRYIHPSTSSSPPLLIRCPCRLLIWLSHLL